MKKCAKCGNEYPATSEYFYKNRSSKSGLTGDCKKCRGKYRENNRKKLAEFSRQWRKRNPDHHRQYMNNYRSRNPSARINHSTSANIRKSLKYGKGGRRWESLVGYTLSELMEHLEHQFKSGMNWDNYGEWHIDHIRPINDFAFDSPNDIGFKECWSLWNLQPLWGKENWSKHDECDEPPLPLLTQVGGE